MTSEDAITTGENSSKIEPSKQKRSPIKFPEDNTELQKKPQEIKSTSATNFRKQSPSGTSPAYIGLNFTREHAVTSVLTRLLPIPKTCIRTFADILDTGKDVVVIISEFRAAYVLGYARVTSALLGPRAIHAAFTSTAAEVCEVTWIKFGEFSKNIFGHMPGIVRSHANGTTFHSGLGAELIGLMDGCARQHSLPTPVTVASNWRDIMTARQPQPSIPHTTRLQGSFSAHAGVRRQAGMMEDPPPNKRPRHGIAPRCGGEQGGFISRHGAENVTNGARGRHTIPPAILAVLGDAPVMYERPTARKRLVELSFEEYLDVYGRIEEEWHRRQLKQAYINSGLTGIGTGQGV